MKWTYLKNDLCNSKLSSLLLFGLITLSSTLFILGITMSIQLFTSINQMMTTARTPDYLFMHTGDVNFSKLEQFANNHAGIKEMEIIEFINIDGSQININGKNLYESVQDNGFISQPPSFDFLLGMDNRVITVQDGEIYLPLMYYQENMDLGDPVIVAGREFNFAGYLRDSQMNSPLSSSKRFLVSENDLSDLKESGSVEYLIEFLLNEGVSPTEFEADYLAAGLPANGPTLTYQLFIIINAMTEGISILILFILALFLMIVTHIALKYSLNAVIENDFSTIGIMKAIGLRNKDIKSLYTSKYALISILATLCGSFLSMVLSHSLTQGIAKFMGLSDLGSYFPMLVIFTIFLFNGAILLMLNNIFKVFDNINPAEAIRMQGSIFKQKLIPPLNTLTLKVNRPNFALAWQEMRQDKHTYLQVAIMYIIAIFIFSLPFNLYTTISHNDFIKYMGIGDYDVIINLQQENNLLEISHAIDNDLHEMNHIENYQILYSKKIPLGDTLKGNILVQIGNHKQFPVAYTIGTPPQQEKDIALSYLLSKELDLNINDTLPLNFQGQTQEFIVSGIYSDLTNGGKTAKISKDDPTIPIMSVSIGLTMKNKDEISNLINAISNKYPDIKINNTSEFMKQVYGPTMSMMQSLSIIGAVLAILLIVLITHQFLYLQMSKNLYNDSVLRVLGFNNRDLKNQYSWRLGIIVLLSLPLGIIISTLLGEKVVGLFFQTLGATAFNFSLNFFVLLVLMPISLVCLLKLIIHNKFDLQWQPDLSQLIKE